jgi:hypothetical protein
MYGMIAFGLYLLFVLIRWPLEKRARSAVSRPKPPPAPAAEDDQLGPRRRWLPSAATVTVTTRRQPLRVAQAGSSPVCKRRHAMCELLGMSANVPTDIVFSFTGLMQRGGRTGPHRDGWGIGFYEGRGLRLFQDPAASSESEVANLVQRYPIKSEVVIGHIRQANVGKVCLSNTHPFVREMWGRNWCFAHNGQLGDFKGLASFYRPVGDTDSEAAFCDLLNRVRSAFPEPVPVEQLLPVLVEACAEYRGRACSTACSATATGCSASARPSWCTSPAARRLVPHA